MSDPKRLQLEDFQPPKRDLFPKQVRADSEQNIKAIWSWSPKKCMIIGTISYVTIMLLIPSLVEMYYTSGRGTPDSPLAEVIALICRIIVTMLYVGSMIIEMNKHTKN